MDVCRELAQQLGPGRTPGERAIAARTLLSLLEREGDEAVIRPIDVVLADCVPSLLQAAQTPTRSATSLAPDPRVTSAAVIDMADAALLLLGHLCGCGLQTLEAAGWHVDDDGTGRGRPIYVHPASGQSQQTPPDLVAEVFGAELDQKDAWALTLLFELSTITSPYANPLDGSLCWPARIRYHEPETNEFTPTNDSTPLPHKLAMTIVDVAQDDDEDEMDEENDVTPEGGKETRLAFTRHLVLGPWHGIPSFRETEIDLDHPPPGSHLESWYTCAMVCAGFLATRKSGRGKCLIVGLGGGAMASFMGRHWPGINVEAVEIDARVVKVAERWFGVKCEPSLLKPEDGVLGDGADEPQHFKLDEDSRPARVRVTNAESFVTSAMRDPECRYDVILLDVYTRGEFPASLVNEQFFERLRGLLKTKENEGWDGALVVNAGVGADRTRVQEIVEKAFPVSKVLLDANASNRMDDDYENAVVLGLLSSSSVPSSSSTTESVVNIDFSAKEWKRRAAEVRESWPEAPLPPFELKNAIHGVNNEIMLAWAGNSMLDEEENEEGGEGQGSGPRLKADDVQLLAKDDPAFSMFD
ncbi:hypothetical protein HDU81_000758 [Chytriomyces hyalinus]|nr:hypothetical protein HDU81_000758 [Chytriomyces hyalinus]